MKIKVLLVDDHVMMREGLRAVLDKRAEYEIVGEAENGRIAVKLVRELGPDVVVMDIGMPDMNGIDATREIKKLKPETRVVALSMHSDRRFVTGMLSAGVSGYVLKSSASKELLHAIEAALDGMIYTSPRVTDVVMQEFVKQLHQPQDKDASPLTPREREVLQLLAEGRTSRAIAETLNISVNTVDTHRNRIMDKLDLHSVADLTKYAIREGITTIGD